MEICHRTVSICKCDAMKSYAMYHNRVKIPKIETKIFSHGNFRFYAIQMEHSKFSLIFVYRSQLIGNA